MSAIVAVTLVLTACGSASPDAAASQPVERVAVYSLIARYEMGAPPTHNINEPWGTQCVSDELREGMKIGRWLGGRMRVVRLVPPVSPQVARVMAIQMSQCPYVEWVEADSIRLVIPER